MTECAETERVVSNPGLDMGGAGKRHTVRLYTLAVFIFPLALCALVTLTGVDYPALKRYRLADIVDGVALEAFQSGFEEAVPFKPAALASVASLRYMLFGQGYPGVIVGWDGWLYSSEEFDPDTGFLHARFDTTIREAATALEKKGIALAVMIVPSKSRVEHEGLGRAVVPAQIQERYAQAVRTVREQGLPVIDSAGQLGSVRGAFLKTDTHWSPSGAAVAAREAATVIGTMIHDLPPATVVVTEGPVVNRTGDLMSFLPPSGTAIRALPDDDVIPSFTTTVDTGLGLFGDPEIAVAIVGTSYSSEPDFNFEGFLKQALQADVLNLAVKGKGPFEPMADVLASSVLEESGVRLVLWEIPERYIPVGSLSGTGN